MADVEQEARAAAHAAYPDADAVAMVCEGKPVGVLVAGNPVNAMARTPYAQGYQAGHVAGAAAARDLNANLLRLIADLTEPEPCRFDHHGGCQEHGYIYLQPGERCPQGEAQELLRNAGVKL